MEKELRPLVANPILSKYWPLAASRSRVTNNLGACLSQARHQLEAANWGLQTLEIPQSRVCDLPAMHWFIAHLLSHLPRLWEAYNQALAAYRRQHKTRSVAHPAPDLIAEGDALEAPFWIWSTDDSRRHRLFVRQRGDELVLTTHAGIEASLTITPDGDAQTTVEQLLALAERGIRIRTRALITTLAARLLLGDLFLHGIGGAKYDQVTDRLIADFFGLEPLGYMVVSGTLHLPISHEPARSADLLQLRQRIRELEFHPERFVEQNQANAAAAGDADHWIAEKRRWIATEQTPEIARTRCRAIRQANEALQGTVGPLRKQWTAEGGQLAEKLHGEAVLSSVRLRLRALSRAALDKIFRVAPGNFLAGRVSYRRRWIVPLAEGIRYEPGITAGWISGRSGGRNRRKASDCTAACERETDRPIFGPQATSSRQCWPASEICQSRDRPTAYCEVSGKEHLQAIVAWAAGWRLEN